MELSNQYFIRWILVGLMLMGLPGLASMSPATEDIWATKADMPTPRYASTSAVNGRIYAIGGGDLGGTLLSTVEEYTPEGWPFAVSLRAKLAATWGNIKRSR